MGDKIVSITEYDALVNFGCWRSVRVVQEMCAILGLYLDLSKHGYKNNVDFLKDLKTDAEIKRAVQIETLKKNRALVRLKNKVDSKTGPRIISYESEDGALMASAFNSSAGDYIELDIYDSLNKKQLGVVRVHKFDEHDSSYEMHTAHIRYYGGLVQEKEDSLHEVIISMSKNGQLIEMDYSSYSETNTWHSRFKPNHVLDLEENISYIGEDTHVILGHKEGITLATAFNPREIHSLSGDSEPSTGYAKEYR